MGGSSSYATEHEIEFLRRIKGWAPLCAPIKAMSKLDLLRGYQRSIPLRTSWGGINKLRIEQEVVALIEREIILS